MPYWQLFYHIVWATKNREPLIPADARPELHAYLRRGNENKLLQNG